MGTVRSVLSQIKHDLDGLGLSRPQGSVKALHHFFLREAQSVGDQRKNINLLVSQQAEAQRVLQAKQAQQLEPGFQPGKSLRKLKSIFELGRVQGQSPPGTVWGLIHICYLLTRVRTQLRLYKQLWPDKVNQKQARKHTNNTTQKLAVTAKAHQGH